MVIGVRTDILFPIRQQADLADGLSGVVENVEFVQLDCLKGHDSFLVEMDDFRPVISRYFDVS
jgi:homoserine acetyltransferase